MKHNKKGIRREKTLRKLMGVNLGDRQCEICEKWFNPMEGEIDLFITKKNRFGSPLEGEWICNKCQGKS